MKTLPRILLVTSLVFGSAAIAGADLVTSYATFFSRGDYRNSKGERLSTIAEVVQQDRANVHKFGNPDGDEKDSYFHSPERREQIAGMIRRGAVGESVVLSMREGAEISVFVDVHVDSAGVKSTEIRERQIRAE